MTKPVRAPGRFLVFGAPCFDDREVEEVVASLRSGWVGTGPKVQRFERAFAAYRRSPHAVAVSSCTAALHLAMLAAEIGQGDEVITTPLTFAATVNAIIHAGATPVLADVDPETMNLDPASVARRVGPNTRAIVPVHFAGRPCDMDGLMAIARAHDLVVIEDCAHAIEAEHRGLAAGTLGDFGCFSFYVTKNVAAVEGGMVLTPSEERAARIKTLALHGMSADAWKRFSDEGFKHYDVVACGFKYNMTDLQAGIGYQQLLKVERSWLRRAQVWQRYLNELSSLPIGLPSPTPEDMRHAYHLFTIRLDRDRTGISRDAFLDHMTRNGIGVGVHYRSVSEHSYYRARFGWDPQDTPNATRIGRTTVSLPLSPALSDEDVSDVVEAVRRGVRPA